MLIAAVASSALGAPGRWPEWAALSASVLITPWLTAPIVAGLLIKQWSTRRDPFVEVIYLQAVAAEMRAGSSVRHALVAAAARVPELNLQRVTRLAMAGRPMPEVAEELCSGLGSSGELAAAAARIGASSGGQLAAAFSTLAAIQSDAIEVEREVRSSTATVRASMAVVAGLPVAGLGLGVLTGRLSAIVALGTGGVVVLLVGVGLLVTGSAAIFALSRTVRV